MRVYRSAFFVAMLVCGFFCGVSPGKSFAAEDPDFSLLANFEYSNPLYSTTTLGQCTGCAHSGNSKKINISVPEMSGTINGRKIVNPEAGHPLVIIFNGTGGTAEGGYAAYMMDQCEKNGWSSFTYDSPFSDKYVNACGRGMPGNFRRECFQAIDLINTFLKDSARRYGPNHYSEIGIVGLSYGAILALLLPEVINDGTLKNPPFQIAGTLALSPPADMLEAAALIDRYGKLKTRFNGVIDVAWAFSKESEKMSPARQHEFTDDELRYIIARAFKHNFDNTKDQAFMKYSKQFGPVCPNADWKEKIRKINFFGKEGSEGRAFMDDIGFIQYFNYFCVPYWENARGLDSGAQIKSDGHLARLLTIKGGNAEAFICSACPLTTRQSMDELKLGIANGSYSTPLYVLPCGGHGDLVQTEFVRHRLKNLFAPKTQLAGSVVDKIVLK